jgi:hypothetical protein
LWKENLDNYMPIDKSYKSMIQNFAKEYKEGKVSCKQLSDKSNVCASETAWSVFYSYLNAHGKKDTIPWSSLDSTQTSDVIPITPKLLKSKKKHKKLNELTIEELEYYHSKAHSLSDKLEEKAKRIHDKMAVEMISRGYAHLKRNKTDEWINV